MALTSFRPRGLSRAGARAIAGAFVSVAALAAQAPVPPPPPPLAAPAAGAPRTPPAAQDPVVTFRTSTRLVVQAVSVKDKQGRPVEGLTVRDFAVTEEGQPQEIAFVEYQRIEGDVGSAPPEVIDLADPVTAAASAAPPATQVAISTPPPGSIKYQNRRLLVFYFDRSSMDLTEQARAFDSARKYIDTQMAAADVLAIMTFQNGAVRVRQDFTADRQRLREVMQSVQYGDDLDLDGKADGDSSSAFGQGDDEFNLFNTDRQLSALQTAVTQLRDLPEQKTLIYFGSGLQLDGTDNAAQFRATTNAALKANVTINPVDARGLSAEAPLGNASARSPGGTAMFSGSGATALIAKAQQSQDSMFALAKDTGGRAMFDFNDLSMGIVQAAQAVTHHYLLGYYSTNTATDGKFRRVSIRLANQTLAADLSYRQGYFADKTFATFTNADKERQLEEALMLENPVTEITIAMELNYFQLNRAEYYVPVAMKIPGSELTLARRRGAARTQIDFIGEIKDEYGITIQNIRDSVDIRLSDEDAEQLARRPIQYENGYVLLPGKYVIKVLARDATTGRIGTYQTDFVVPNLVREEKYVPISSVILSAQRVPLEDALFSVQRNAANDAVNPLIHDGQKLIPSVTRVFSVSKELYVYLHAYQRNTPTMRPLVAFVTFYRGDETVLETMPLPVTSGMDPKSKSIALRFSVPLSEITPGRYDCQVTVLDPEAQKAAFWRKPIIVVP
jgi:VWFA-related protein